MRIQICGTNQHISLAQRRNPERTRLLGVALPLRLYWVKIRTFHQWYPTH